jgi:hypothetical protein
VPNDQFVFRAVLKDPTMPKKAAAIGQSMAGENGVEKAIQIVEKIFM